MIRFSVKKTADLMMLKESLIRSKRASLKEMLLLAYKVKAKSHSEAKLRERKINKKKKEKLNRFLRILKKL